MLIEALIPMNLTLPEGTTTLQPGDRVDLPEEKAQKLFRLAKGKIRVVESHLHPGVWIEFFSPLFGPCTAQVDAVTLTGYILSHHSVLPPSEHPEIPAAWVRGIYCREQQASGCS